MGTEQQHRLEPQRRHLLEPLTSPLPAGCLVHTMRSIFFALLVGCGEPAVEPVPALTPTTQAASGWGAIFWRDGQAWRVGQGDVAIGAAGSAKVQVGASGGPCGGVAITGAPDRAVATLPAGASLPAVDRPPAIAASLVERAAWRIDEVLPARDPFSPNVATPAPSQSRGVQVGSVAKIRRTNAPPFLISVGVRDCQGALVVLDANGEKRLDHQRIGDTCDTLRLLPPADYDGDGLLDAVVTSERRVVVFGVDPTSGKITSHGDWTCDAAAAP